MKSSSFPSQHPNTIIHIFLKVFFFFFFFFIFIFFSPSRLQTPMSQHKETNPHFYPQNQDHHVRPDSRDHGVPPPPTPTQRPQVPRQPTPTHRPQVPQQPTPTHRPQVPQQPTPTISPWFVPPPTWSPTPPHHPQGSSTPSHHPQGSSPIHSQQPLPTQGRLPPPHSQQPPPTQGRLPPPHSQQGLPPPHSKGKKAFIWSIAAFCAIFWIIVIVGGLIVLIVYLVYRPQSPRFNVSSVTLNAAYLDMGYLLNADVTVLANFTNPNKKVKVHFSYIIIDLYYGNTPIATTAIEPFSATSGVSMFANLHMVSSQVRLSVKDSQRLAAQIQSNRVAFKINGLFRTRSDFGGFLKYSYWLYSHCSFVVTAPPSGVLVASKCRTKR